MKKFVTIFVVAAVLCVGTYVYADPPNVGHGKTKHQKELNKSNYDKKSSDYGKRERSSQRHRYFNDDQRAHIQDYYSTRYRKGGCPPGLLKKNNRCMPPGQAKKRWEIGRRLPREVIFHDLSPILLERLGPPPAGHRYVRVAQDILLITTGVGMVVDAIDDLNWELRR